MQFLVETGQGIENANSYASVEAADDYALFWDYPEWIELDTEVKERWLILASSYMDSYLSYPSRILNSKQGLLYPRKPFISVQGRQIEGLPESIEEAASRIAFLLNDGLEPTRKTKLLKAQSYGSSSETYLGAWSEQSDNQLRLNDILAKLSALGLGGKSVKQVAVVRG